MKPQKSKLVQCAKCENRWWQFPPIPADSLCANCEKNCEMCDGPIGNKAFPWESRSGQYQPLRVCQACYQSRLNRNTIDRFLDHNPAEPVDNKLKKSQVFSKRELKKEIHHFTYGFCEYLALALNQLYDYPIMALWLKKPTIYVDTLDEISNYVRQINRIDSEICIHVFVQPNPNIILDAQGRRTIFRMIRDFKKDDNSIYSRSKSLYLYADVEPKDSAKSLFWKEPFSIRPINSKMVWRNIKKDTNKIEINKEFERALKFIEIQKLY